MEPRTGVPDGQERRFGADVMPALPDGGTTGSRCLDRWSGGASVGCGFHGPVVEGASEAEV